MGYVPGREYEQESRMPSSWPRFVAVVLTVVGALGVAEIGAAAGEARPTWAAGVTVVDSPLSPRASPAITTTGTEVIVLGGAKPSNRDYPEQLRRDGAIFDLKTRHWTRIPPSPLDPPIFPSAVWTGHELVVLGTGCISESELEDELECGGREIFGAVYTRDTDSWRALDVPNRYSRRGSFSSVTALVWTGSEAIFLYDGDLFVAVDPRTDRFRSVEAPGSVGLSTNSTCVSGKQVTVDIGFGGVPRLFLLDTQELRWTPAPSLPADIAVSGTQQACARSSVIAAKGDLSKLVRYDLTSDEWSAVSPPTMRPIFDCSGVSGCDGYAFAGHGRVIDFWRPEKHGLRYNTATGAWTRIAAGPAPYGPMVWAGGLAAMYGDLGVPGRALTIYNPARIRDPAQPDVLLNFETGQVVAEGLNEYITAEQPDWARDAGNAAAELSHLVQGLRFARTDRRLGGGQTEVTITLSILGEIRNKIRYTLVFEDASDGYVRFVSGTWGQHCVSSRDENDFSLQTCVE